MSVDSTLITIVFIFLVFYYLYICILAIFVRTLAGASSEDGYKFIFFIPCRNEEKVIAQTLKKIFEVSYPNVETLVINDGSTDDTERIVRELEISHDVELINTVEPGRGKGEALNFGFRHVIKKLRTQGTSDYEKVIIGIVDADGQVSPNICGAVEPYFNDPQVGAVQTSVRIANAESNLIAACQDVEFTGFSQSIQRGRDRLGSVGLGGNGQFVRLSALCSLSLESPWSRSLTEDLDIGLRLIYTGWKVRFCHSAYVAQQGVESFRPLIIQRVRWMQGHYSCWKYIPKLLANRNLPLRTRLDNTAYLVLGVTPFIVFVSILLSLFSALGVISVKNTFSEILLGTSFFLYIFMFYLLSFVIAIVFVSFYVRYTKSSIWRLIYFYHVFAIYTLMWIPASIGALINLIRGETVWVKTGRTAIEEFSEMRRHPRVEFSCPLEVFCGDESIVVTIKDVACGGVGVLTTKQYFLKFAKKII